jgi:hypothetical protein
MEPYFWSEEMNPLFEAAMKNPQFGGGADFYQEHPSGMQYVVTVRGVPDFARPIWHISIFRSGTPVKDWRELQILEATCLLKELCKELDMGNEPIRCGLAAVHFRRELNDEEMAQLDPKWLEAFERFKKWNTKALANQIKRGQNT